MFINVGIIHLALNGKKLPMFTESTYSLVGRERFTNNTNKRRLFMRRNYFSGMSVTTIVCFLLTFNTSSKACNELGSSLPYAETKLRSSKTQGEGTTTELRHGVVIERELMGGERHSYVVRLTAGQYMHLVVQQQGIDVLVSVFGPGNEKVMEVDSPNGRYGPEPVSLISQKTGEYRLEITALTQGTPSGRYHIRLEELRQAEGKDRDRIETERILADAARLQGRATAEALAKSTEKYNQGLLLLRMKGNRWADPRTLSTIEGETLYAIGSVLRYESPENAVEYLQQALSIRRALGDRRAMLTTLSEIGMAYLRLSENQKALDYLEQALPLARVLGEKDSLASTLNRIGVVYSELGDDKAIECLSEALLLTREIGNPSGEAAILTNLGGSLSQAGRLKQAINVYNQALLLARSAKDQRGEASALSHIGQVYTWLREPNKSIEFFDQALLLAKTVGDRFSEAKVLSGIGESYVALGRIDEGLRYLDQALSLHRALGDRIGEAESLLRTSFAERSLGHLNEARARIETALNMVENSRAALVNRDLRNSFVASNQRYYKSYIDLLMQMHLDQPSSGYEGLALEVAEKSIARSFLEMLNEERNPIRNGIEPELLARQISLRADVRKKSESLSRLTNSRHAEQEVPRVSRELDDLLEAYDDLQVRIRTKNPRYAALTEPQPVSLKDVQGLLDDDTLLLEYSLGPERSFLWVVSSRSIKSFVLPAQDQIETETQRVRDLQVKKADLLYPQTLARFSQMLLGPVAEELGRKRLLVVAQGALHYISFAALPEPVSPSGNYKNGDSGSGTKFLPLILKHEVVNLPSASVLAELRRETASREVPPKKVAVFADPVFTPSDHRVISQQLPIQNRQHGPTIGSVPLNSDVKRSADELGLNGFARLPFSRREADEITNLVPNGLSEKAMDFDASLVKVSHPELADYQILHFATHSLLNNQHPGLSGIVLSLVDKQGREQDGFLRLADIYNLNLRANLVVLSACETALGKNVKGEGVIGLTRAFMYAGTPRVIASLWKVSDRATVELMKRFYTNMLKKNMRPAAALRAAQLSMSTEKQWAAPYYWAGFILQGDWQ